jgi:hypothetical protein
MSFSEDPTSPAAPFSGDGSGQIFEMPDMVAGSPTTSERVVDTQSGFLVVIKRLNDHLCLSIKRQIGTPPNSSVSLTPDESLKLSRIIAGSLSSTDDWNSLSSARKERRSGSDRRRSMELSSGLKGEGGSQTDLEIPDEVPASLMPVRELLISVLRRFMIPIVGIILCVFTIGIGAGITSLQLFSKNAPAAPTAAAVSISKDTLDPQKVDGFVRVFVTRLLDFTAKSYRISQVQAMASMSPDLLERYWKETRFPLSRRQLSALPHGTSVVIGELKQTPLDAKTVSVDVHAQITSAENPNNATPVNLRLKLALDESGQIAVVEQQDLSSKASK